MPYSSGKKNLAAAAVVCLLAALVAQVSVAIRGQSLTWDEGDHIFSGVEIWRVHDYGYNPEHPPMVKMLGGLPLLGLHLRMPEPQGRFFKTEAYLDGKAMLYGNGPAHPARELIFRARIVEIVFAVAAALLVFAAGTEMFSLEAGLCALLLFCFEPTLVAHGAYVTTDMAASCTIFGAIYALWRWAVRPTGLRLVVVGLAAGVALAAKHSTVLLAPMIVVLLCGEWTRAWWVSRASEGAVRRQVRRTALVRILLAIAAIVVIGTTVLWSFYGFRYSGRPAGLSLSPSLAEYVAPLAGREARGILWVARFHLLPESYLYGLADVRSMANGMPSFFMGHVYAHGVWFYFPVLFLIKQTLGMLVLLLLLTPFAIVAGWCANGRALWFLVLPPVLYFAVAMTSHLNIGARHIMPTFVFGCALAGATAAALLRRRRGWAVIAGVLLAAHVGSSLHAYPNGMAYANEAWGGPTQTYRFLSDSNTDWGQQLVATSKYLRDNHISKCWFAYFVDPFVEPKDYGIPCNPLPTPDTEFSDVAYDVPPVIDGTVLISAGDLNSFELGSSVLNAYEAFRARAPIASIQDGVLVYQGSFAVPLASALGHVVRSKLLLKEGNKVQALREAETAEGTAPGEVEPEMALGDALAASGRNVEARQAYGRVRQRINQMDADARASWQVKLNTKVKATE